MPRYVALLRGINVGGHRSLRMTDLRAMVEAIGGTDVTTYIQSGNVVFDHASRSPGEALRAQIEKATGFDITLITRTARQLAAVVEANPFPKASGGEVHVAFMTKPSPKALAGFDLATYAPQTCAVIGSECYLYLPEGIGRSKFAAKVLSLPPFRDCTLRNWRTVQKLVELSSR